MKKNLYTIVSLVLLAILSLPLGAQTIEFKDDEGSDLLRISTLDLSTSIANGVAQTTIRLTMSNSSGRNRGGNLSIPLPPGAMVTGYSLDVAGLMVPAVPVERVEARQVYETIVRRGVDPGLIEEAQGDVFRTRVFPVLPGESRIFEISYLSALEGEGAREFQFPLAFDYPLEQFELDIEILNIGSEPQVANPRGLSVQLAPFQNGYRSQTSARNVRLNGDLGVQLPQSPLDQSQGEAVVSEVDGESFVFSLVSIGPSTEQTPKKIAMYLDQSFSARNRDHDALMDVIRSLAQIGGPGFELSLIPFAHRPLGQLPSFSGGQLDELDRYIAALPFDGGSRYDNLPQAPGGTELVLVVSDGLPTIGQQLPPWDDTPVAVLMDGDASNYSFLSRLAGTDGSVISLHSARAETVAQQVLSSGLGARAQVAAGRLSEVQLGRLPGRSDLLLVAARLRGTDGVLEVRGGDGQVQRIEVSPSTARAPSMARNVWVQLALQELLATSGSDADSKASVRNFGLEYSVVTPGTSLLVLESVDQYVEFRIPPPRDLAEWRDEYFQRVAQMEKELEESREDTLDFLAQRWADKVSWWEELHKAPKDEPTPLVPSPEPRGEESWDEPEGPSYEADGDVAMNREIAQSPVSGAQGEESYSPRGEGQPGSATIEVQAWNPRRPYLVELQSLTPSRRYQGYLDLREDYLGSPGFFLDVGDFFLNNGEFNLAVSIWTTIGELGFGDVAIMRIVAQRLSQAEQLEEAELIFKTVLEDRPDEPQSHRDLALLHARMGRYREAVEGLYRVGTSTWDRTYGIDMVALVEFNRYLEEALIEAGSRDYIEQFDQRFIDRLTNDIRIVLSWDADMTDMDLWVTEPSGFKVYYGDNRSYNGGYLSNDITSGYGPEEYFIRRAPSGSYEIEVNYYGSSSPELTGNVTLFVDVYTNYGRDNEEVQRISLQLNEAEDLYFVGSVTID